MLRLVFGLTLGFFAVAVPAHGDVLHNVGTGLALTSFDVSGNPNPLSGGAELAITRQFTGDLFDFGATELTLQGPISLEVDTGGRLLPQLDVSFSTAINSRNQATPLSYQFVVDGGGQTRTVSGSTLIDADFSINALGFYDLNVTYSSRQAVDREGNVANDTNTLDSDIGPISLSGNIFADALAVMTDPFFEQSGRENPFAVLSKTLIDPQLLGSTDLLSFADLSGSDGTGFRGFDSLHSASARQDESSPNAHAVVPEPPVLILLLLGIPAIVHRTCRDRTA